MKLRPRVDFTVRHPEIPIGTYCYAEQPCPHYGHRMVNGVKLPWCGHLRAGSVPCSAGSISDADLALLKEVWGEEGYTREQAEEAVKDGLYAKVEEALARRWHKTPKEFDLFLLWDQCKECPHNQGSDEVYFGIPPRQATYLPLVAHGFRNGKPTSFGVTLRMTRGHSLSEQVREVARQLRRLPRRLRQNLKGFSLSHVKHGDQRLILLELCPSPLGLVPFAANLCRAARKQHP